MKTIYEDRSKKIRVLGKDSNGFLEALKTYLANEPANEAIIRLNIQNLLDRYDPECTVLYNGNTVWPYEKIIKQFARLLKANDTRKMTKYMYSFMNLETGTIAHFNLRGWAHVYPDNVALKRLWRCNEYGYPVYGHQPGWKTDVQKIVLEMHRMLNRRA